MVNYLFLFHGFVYKLTFLFYIFNFISGYDLFSCLHLKSLCRKIPECKFHLRHLESKCGISLQRCETNQISDCVHCLKSIKDILGVYNSTCWCYENLGEIKQCEHFRTKIWSHPCEKRLNDFNIQNELLFQVIDPEPLQDPLLLIDDYSYEQEKSIIKRTTRSPVANEIEQWRHQLIDVLPSIKPIQTKSTCHSALYDVCLKHISCKELWKIFRQSCFVDAQNQCKMTNKDNCWQAFEGISWTGLGNCTCQDNNSDCHWIRLQTNYNKCIYELSLLGYTSRYSNFPSTYIQQYQTHNKKIVPKNYIQPLISTTTTPLTTTTTTTTTTRPPPTTKSIKSYYPDNYQYNLLWEKQRALEVERRKEIELTRQERKKFEEERRRLEEEKRQLEEEKRKLRRNQEVEKTQLNSRYMTNNQYKNRYLNQSSRIYPSNIRVDLRTNNRLYSTPDTVVTSLSKPPTNYYVYSSESHNPKSSTEVKSTSTTTTTTPITSTVATTETIKPTIYSDLSYKNFEIKVKHSTCHKVYKKCELNETCKWHLSEVKMRCSSESTCVRMQCASALRRFSRYVSRELAEAVTFCQCAENDSECIKNRDIIHPTCMNIKSETEIKLKCTDIIKNCKSDIHCNRHLPYYNSSCTVNNDGKCETNNFKKCRHSIMSIRGTYFETSCYCPENDEKCLKYQKMMIPNNPCIEKSIKQYYEEHKNEFITEKIKNENFIKNKIDNPTTSDNMLTDTVTILPALSNNNITTTNKSIISTTSLQTTTSTTTTTTTSVTPIKKKIIFSKEKLSQDMSFQNDTIIDTIYPTTTLKPRRKNLHTYPTDAYVTHAPPQSGGCLARNIDGGWITHYKDSVVRHYRDWSGRCSSWCECSQKEVLKCHSLPCLNDGYCNTAQTKIAFGEKLYIEGRGACICHSGEFICDTPDDFPEELEPGLYITIGYSMVELKMFKEKIPKNYNEKSGLVSPDVSIAKDIVSRLQFALERVLPKDTLCRIIILEDLSHDENVVLQLQWYGIDQYANETKPEWHIGRMEKICAPYVKQLEYMFLLEKAERYQLLLSAVKQLKVFDLLDGLPTLNAAIINHLSFIIIVLMFSFLKLLL